MPEPLLKIQNLSFSFGKKKILKDVSFTLGASEIVTLVGRSGAGKTTLFNILTGILPVEQGSISCSGHLQEMFSYMTQEDLLLPWRTVLGNLLLLSELGSNPKTCSLKKEALDMLDEMGMLENAQNYPDQLSGGMRQRVSLARSLLQKRPLLFLDEPFGSLDIVLKEQIYELLRKMKRKLNCTIFMITHDFHDALCLSDRILLLHEGSIQQIWDVDSKVRENIHQLTLLSQEIRSALFKCE